MRLKNDRKVILKQFDPFLNKFEGRYEKMGAGGIKDVSLNEFIISNKIIKKKDENKKNPYIERKNNEKMYSRMMNQYNLMTTEDYKRISLPKKNNNFNLSENYQNQFEDNYNDYKSNNNNIKINNNSYDIKEKNKNNDNNNNIINLNINKNKRNNNVNNNINLINYNNKNNSSYNFNNSPNEYNGNNSNSNNNYNSKLNHNNSYPRYEYMNDDYDNISDMNLNKPSLIDHERFYKPYSLKEYRNIMENYKNNKFGGLGKNMNKEWKEREKKMNKVKKFENSVVKNFNEKIHNYNYKRLQSPQKMELIKIGKQIMNSKRFLAQKYGKGVMLNKVRDKKKKEIIEMNNIKRMKHQEEYMKKREYERKQRDEDIVNIYDNVVNEKHNNYIDKLIQLKSSLI